MGTILAQGHGRTDELAARIALVALRAGMPARERGTGRFVLESSSEVLNPDQAARLLAGLPKPLRCEGSSRFGTIILRCQRITDPVLLKMQQSSADSDLAIHGSYIQTLSNGAPGDPMILVRGYAESCVVPFSALASWFRQYRVVPSVMVIWPPDQVARRKGAAAVIEFGQGEVSSFHDSAP